MPVTPFHFGPGLAAKAIVPRWFSWSAFVVVQVVIDVETLYSIVQRSYPLHTFFHTLVGATTAGMAVGIAMIAARKTSVSKRSRAAGRLTSKRVLQGETSNVGLVAGSVIGGTSHAILDSVMHADMMPFLPFSTANPFLHVISLSTLHVACVGAGVLGGAVLLIRWTRGGGME